MKYYTKTGDNGSTLLPNNIKIDKDAEVLSVIGDIDELNSLLGLVQVHVDDDYIVTIIKGVQNRLFNISAEIIMQNSKQDSEKIAKIALSEQDLKELEDKIDDISAKIPELKKFIIPGGAESAAWLHYARAVTRRIERNVVSFSKTLTAENKEKLNPIILKYINRLSSFLFVAARYMNKKEGIEEDSPTYR
ncbi:MAG: cob(I)yrinic acid a,c-diamide adenosyltransferase [Candidatus Micrarchaeia archaeon]